MKVRKCKLTKYYLSGSVTEQYHLPPAIYYLALTLYYLRLTYECFKFNPDAAAVPGTEAATSRDLTFFSSRRLLRAFLRRCDDRLPRAANHTHRSAQGEW